MLISVWVALWITEQFDKSGFYEFIQFSKLTFVTKNQSTEFTENLRNFLLLFY